MLASGVLAALLQAERTGMGDKVSVNLYHAAIWAHSIGICAHQFGAPYPTTRYRVKNPFNNQYQSRDGVWFLICMPDYDKYFDQMFRMLGKDDYLADETIGTLAEINASGKQEFVINLISDGFAQKDYEEWDAIMLEQQVPHQKLFDYDDILADKEAYDNDALRRYESFEFGPRVMTTSPVRFHNTGHPPIALAKPTGYHTYGYLRHLGYSELQIKELEEKGAIKCWHGPEIEEVVIPPNK